MKIVSSGKAIHSPGFLKKKRRNKRIKLIVLAILVLALISFIIYLFHLDKFLINKVVVTGDDPVSAEDVAEVARDAISGSYAWVFPRANAFIYPRKNVEESISQKFPRFKSVNANLESLKTLNIVVEERSPDFLYCIDPCFFMDENGFVFERAPTFENEVYLIYRTTRPITDPVGKNILPQDSFVMLSKFVSTLTNFGINGTSLEIGDVDYILTIASGGKIIWERDNDLDLVYSNLEAFFSDEDIKSQQNFLERISQLDLRTENKVFYRFKNE